MIDLLERLAAVEQDALWPRGRESGRALALLEWPQVTAQVAGYCRNRRAAEQVRRRRPYLTREPIALQWELADELRSAVDAGTWPPLHDVAAVVDAVQRPRPWRLTGEELIDLAAAAAGLDELRAHLQGHRGRCPTLGCAASQMADFSGLAAHIRRCLDRDGSLLDSASPLLRRLRRAAAAQEQVVRQAVAKAMAEARRQGWTTDSEVTLRGDRYCLPVRSGTRGKIPGIVHDRSASGGTLYVEPAAVVQLHNSLAELRFELAGEELRILQELNQAVEQSAAALDEACRFLLLVDQVVAGLRWSVQVQGRRPGLARRGRLRICRGRHPLLLRHGRGSQAGPGLPQGEPEGAICAGEVVPLDLQLPAGIRAVLISGPNAGGKSVALKTVGLLVLLAQCGWDIPAREDTEIPLVRQIFVDLGDEQSIAKSLSSFSAHLSHLVRFLAMADGDSLVLCDEIGSGTDPQEGTALAYTVLEGLCERGATVLASTHFGLLKAAVHDHAAMINAAMDYDEQTLSPLFTLRLGDPGASRAFDIAERWGFPPELLQRARALVGEERFQIERLLDELGTRSRALATAEREWEEKLAAQHRDEMKLQQRLQQADRECAEILQRTRLQGEQLLADGRKIIEQTVRELRSSGGAKIVTRKAKQRLASLADQLPGTAADPPSVDLEPGDDIWIPHLGLTGQVVEMRANKIIATAAGMRLTLTRQAVQAVPEPPEAEPGARGPEASWRWREAPPEIAHELDLRGRRVEEAWQQLDLLIDRVIPAGLERLLVIHGFGTGRLRKVLHERLAADPRVDRFEAASADEGGAGATLVWLAVD